MCPRCKSRLYDRPKQRPITLGDGLGIEEILRPHRDEVLRLAREHGASNVRVFGSVRRRRATASSDVDLLVDWQHGSDALHLALDLERLLHRKVDIATARHLWWAAAPHILREAVPL